MRLKLDARARRILRRMPVVNVYSVVELALLAGLAVQCARLAWTIVTPITPLGDWRPAAPMVVGSPADILRGFDPFFRLGGTAGAPATVTSLQLTLFGTRMDEAMGRSSAIIAGPDGVQQSVAVGDEIQPGVRLKAVAFDHVTIDRGGADEDLFLDQSGSVTPHPCRAVAERDRLHPADRRWPHQRAHRPVAGLGKRVSLGRTEGRRRRHLDRRTARFRTRRPRPHRQRFRGRRQRPHYRRTRSGYPAARHHDRATQMKTAK
jgi:hypothetical protein